MMTAYLVYERLKKGQLNLTQELPVSEKAWRMQGSKMFVALNSTVKVEDLIRGMIVQSGADAAIALAVPLFWWASGLSVAAMAAQLGLGLGVFAVLAALFAAGAVGGGDVKLLSALALWIKPLWFVQLLVVMALAGGVLSVLSIVWRLRQRERRGARGVPYGIAIALGGLWVLVCDYLPLAAARIG